MKSIWSNLGLRDAGCKRPQSDSDVDAKTPWTFCINIRSIRCVPEADQPHRDRDVNIEKPVSASLVHKATENLIGKAFLEAWCDTHGYLKPDRNIVYLVFTIVGQTQPFESLHQIVDKEDSVLFHPNRLPTKLDRPSLLEVQIQEYSKSLSKRKGKGLHKEVMAVRSRTWPSRMKSLRRWSGTSGNQYARKKPQDKPVIRLDAVKCHADARQYLVDSGDVDERRDEVWEPLVRLTSEYASGGDITSKVTTSPVATTFGGGLPRNNSERQLTPPIKAGANTPGLDDGLRTIECVVVHQDENTANATAFQGSDVPEMLCDPSPGPNNHSPSILDKASGTEESQMLVPSRRAFQQAASDRVDSFFPETDGSQPDHTLRSPSLVSSTPGMMGTNSIIRNVSRADGSVTQESGQPGELGIGSMRGDTHDCIAQVVSTSCVSDLKGTVFSMKKSHGLDRATVRKDEPLEPTKSFRPSGSPSAVNSAPRNGGDLGDPRFYCTNAVTAASTKSVAESDSRKQEPGGSNEMDTWDFCQVSDQESMRSSDSDGLPFPDDYWIYDEKAKNYYHVEVGDNGTQTISWYPLEFD